MSAGEAVGDAVFAYCRDELGIVVNEMFGQTEINYVVGNCHLFWPPKAGSMGRGYPGHWVAVIDEQGEVCKPGEPGEVAVSRYDRHGDPDPVFFLGYWKNDKATEDKFTKHWCRTGDVAIQDKDGYLWYQGRTDDMFKAAGYRIGQAKLKIVLSSIQRWSMPRLYPSQIQTEALSLKLMWSCHLSMSASVNNPKTLKRSISKSLLIYKDMSKVCWHPMNIPKRSNSLSSCP
jgi:acyl-CoA synthetase (AMP-forming)/AMP-acid ligase II